MFKTALSAVVVGLAILATGALAAGDAVMTEAKPGEMFQFDPRIDTWVEGAIITLDADGSKFAVRGVKLPYATAYAEMMKDQNEKLKNVEPADRQAKIDEVNRAWADRLAAARTEKLPAKESDFTFSLPREINVRILPESAVRNAEFLRVDKGVASTQKPGAEAAEPVAYDKKAEADSKGTDVKGAEKEVRAALTFKDLKIGDRVLLGYDAGMVTNEAYVVIKRTK